MAKTTSNLTSIGTVADLDTGDPIYVVKGGNSRKAAAGNLPALLQAVGDSQPLVILESGQSNVIDFQTYEWSPPENLTVWNWSYLDTGAVGTAFEGVSSAEVSYGEVFAARVARANPTRQVRLIKLGYSAMSITHWLEGTSDPNIYGWIQANVPPALTAAGTDKVDIFLWWQGGSDLNDRVAYPGRFETLIDRLEAETWWSPGTSILVTGLAPTSISGAAQSDLMNVVLMSECAGPDPVRRQFFNLGMLTDTGLWRDTQHMNGEGYYMAGLLAHLSFAQGYGRVNVGQCYTGPVDPDNWIVPGALSVSGAVALGANVVGPSSSWTVDASGNIVATSLGVGLAVFNPLTSFVVTTTPSPAVGQVLLYAKADKKLYALDSGGLETALF